MKIRKYIYTHTWCFAFSSIYIYTHMGEATVTKGWCFAFSSMYAKESEWFPTNSNIDNSFFSCQFYFPFLNDEFTILVLKRVPDMIRILTS